MDKTRQRKKGKRSTKWETHVDLITKEKDLNDED